VVKAEDGFGDGRRDHLAGRPVYDDDPGPSVGLPLELLDEGWLAPRFEEAQRVQPEGELRQDDVAGRERETVHVCRFVRLDAPDVAAIVRGRGLVDVVLAGPAEGRIDVYQGPRRRVAFQVGTGQLARRDRAVVLPWPGRGERTRVDSDPAGRLRERDVLAADPLNDDVCVVVGIREEGGEPRAQGGFAGGEPALELPGAGSRERVGLQKPVAVVDGVAGRLPAGPVARVEGEAVEHREAVEPVVDRAPAPEIKGPGAVPYQAPGQPVGEGPLDRERRRRLLV
jgi:hypothetical protein